MANKVIFVLVLVFGALLLLDGIFLPGVFGFREGVLASVFILAMLLNWGVTIPVLWIGSGSSLFLELFWKLQPGSLMLLFLAAALAYFFISSFFSVKRYAGAAILSFGLWLVFWHNGFAVAVTAFAGFSLCFFIFDRVEVRNDHAKF